MLPFSKIVLQKIFKKSFYGIIVLMFLGIISWMIYDYIKTYTYPIKHVKIFATYEHVNKIPLQKTVDAYLNKGFFKLNVAGLKQQLLSFPWIYAVSIKRIWPDTVIINIAEQRPILQWGDEALINPDGRVFYPQKNSFPKGLPVIFGPKGSETQIFNLYSQMLSMLEPLDLSIKNLALDPAHHWEIKLNNDTAIFLNTADPLDQLELLTRVYRKITADRHEPPKSIDMRYSSGMAVKWR
jgi:cell division protein FtsQ